MLKNKKYRTIKTTPFKFNLEEINPLFSKAKIYVMYHGENRNNSYISKESVERAFNSLKNIPIVGEFIERDDGEGNFGSHGGKIEIDDKGIRFIQTTKPVGLIPESAEIYWKVIEDEKEIEREYLVVDGALLWNRYRDEINTLKKDNFGQSMEIEVTDGEWDDETNIYDIKDFLFSALCILGIDKDGEGHVEPAFEDAKIIAYSLDKEMFKKEFTQMIDELNYSMSVNNNEIEKGDSKMLKELLKKYSITAEQLIEKGIDFNEVPEDELEGKIVEAFEINPEQKEVAPEVLEEDEKEEFTEQINELNEKLINANKTITSLELEVESLKEFKLQVEKESHEAEAKRLFNSLKLTEEDISDLDIHSFTIDEIKEKCYAIIGKKMTEKMFSKAEDDNKNVTIHLPVDESDKKSNVTDITYGGLFDERIK